MRPGQMAQTKPLDVRSQDSELRTQEAGRGLGKGPRWE
eukprot:CAMPEP_0180151474 /NCGR_PEP_ID=MMETSP0986-20121125/22150_1 /TAXON_ID=697907 /ORGANISM="non described non described, Strain CCMP2293" /LENGTH=37 /DNA_ID= /DNA_START= /DNA_END= /DNA_ORIENTATION=